MATVTQLQNGIIPKSTLESYWLPMSTFRHKVSIGTQGKKHLVCIRAVIIQDRDEIDIGRNATLIKRKVNVFLQKGFASQRSAGHANFYCQLCGFLHAGSRIGECLLTLSLPGKFATSLHQSIMDNRSHEHVREGNTTFASSIKDNTSYEGTVWLSHSSRDGNGTFAGA